MARPGEDEKMEKDHEPRSSRRMRMISNRSRNLISLYSEKIALVFYA
jgi:hypothetical protein